MPIRVVVADDHTIFREGLLTILSAEGFDVVVDVGTTGEALAAVAEHTPDLALYDVHMPTEPAIALIAKTRREAPGTKIAMLSMHTDPRLVNELMQAGAHGYFNKTLSRRDLCDGLSALVHGDDAVTIVPRSRPGAATPAARLTDEETGLLEGLVAGRTNKQLAAEGFRSEATVKRQLQRLYERIGASSRVEAVTIASRMGITAREDPLTPG